MFLKRALRGLAIGLLLGPLTVTLVQLYWEADTSLQAVDIGTIITVGGLFGVPVAIIIALAAGAGMIEYRSGLGVEWGLVGALAAVLVERSAALIFKDTSYEMRITGATLIVYALTAIALAVAYIGLLGYASSLGD